MKPLSAFSPRFASNPDQNRFKNPSYHEVDQEIQNQVEAGELALGDAFAAWEELGRKVADNPRARFTLSDIKRDAMLSDLDNDSSKIVHPEFPIQTNTKRPILHRIASAPSEFIDGVMQRVDQSLWDGKFLKKVEKDIKATQKRILDDPKDDDHFPHWMG